MVRFHIKHKIKFYFIKKLNILIVKIYIYLNFFLKRHIAILHKTGFDYPHPPTHGQPSTLALWTATWRYIKAKAPGEACPPCLGWRLKVRTLLLSGLEGLLPHVHWAILHPKVDSLCHVDEKACVHHACRMKNRCVKVQLPRTKQASSVPRSKYHKPAADKTQSERNRGLVPCWQLFRLLHHGLLCVPKCASFIPAQTLCSRCSPRLRLILLGVKVSSSSSPPCACHRDPPRLYHSSQVWSVNCHPWKASSEWEMFTKHTPDKGVTSEYSS